MMMMKMISSNYRLGEDELHRIVNSCGAANDLSWCVKDLLLAHYVMGGYTDALQWIADVNKGIDLKTLDQATLISLIWELRGKAAMALKG